MDFLENRRGGYYHRVLSGNLVRQKNNENEACDQSSIWWYSDNASCAASYSCRFFLLIIFSLRRPFGKFLLENFDFKIVQTWKGCIVAAAVIAFPLMYRNARAAFEQVDVNLIYAGQTLGMSDRKIFWKVIIPAAAPGIVSGTVLAFARAIGNTAQPPCLQEIFWEKQEPFLLQLRRRLRREIMM